MKNNFNIKYPSEYTKIIKEEDIDENYIDKGEKINLNNNKLSNIINNENKNKNDYLVSINTNTYKDSNTYRYSKINEDNYINSNNNEENNINTELDIRQKEIKNLNRNIKNYINSNFLLKESNFSSLYNHSIPRAKL